MLREIATVKQMNDELHKRWFNSATMNLFVWLNHDNHIITYQLTYTLDAEDKALIWDDKQGLTHSSIDESRSGHHPASPLLIADHHYDVNKLITLFNHAAQNIEEDIKAFIVATMQNHATPR